MILSLIRIFPRLGQEHSTLEVLESLRGPTAASSGCAGCSVAVEPGASGVICYTERWRNREALDRHLRSALYRRLLEVLEHSQLPPEICFYEATAVGGLELVEKVRLPQ